MGVAISMLNPFINVHISLKQGKIQKNINKEVLTNTKEKYAALSKSDQLNDTYRKLKSQIILSIYGDLYNIYHTEVGMI